MAGAPKIDPAVAMAPVSVAEGPRTKGSRLPHVALTKVAIPMITRPAEIMVPPGLGIAHRPRHDQGEDERGDVDQRVLPRVKQRLGGRRHVVDPVMGDQNLDVLLPDTLLVLGCCCGRFVR